MPESATAVPARLKTVLELARQEADRRGDRRIGTDQLLLALLHDQDAPPARALGVTLDQGREALDAMDRAALAALGIHFDGRLAPRPVRGQRRMSLSSSARTLLVRAKEISEGERRGRRIDSRHLLLALLATRHPDPAADLLTELGLRGPEISERLAGC
ncbi:Clp protease N-terminal domain-containing protein [Streptomyces polygonati]|uniref:Clp protease N-terminal domain-containing protein n=1 Tax=Streptomyces polygonati TaxID=1617087 RepID=A0ABV8HTC2_9ACTN